VLIVNADDYGASPSATDPIVAAYGEGLISSATAMVWMSDSERAAQLARDRGMPLGLHLNFTLAFRDKRGPARVRDLQEELTHVFSASSWSEDGVARHQQDPRIREAVADQLAAFRAVYGEPTHIDGHHHVHVHPAVLACLPPELPIRPVLHTPAEIAGRPTPRDRMLHKLFRSADACVAFQHVHPAFGGAGLQLLEFARKQTLEVMVHPQLEQEQLALRTPEWVDAMSCTQLGSYRDLPTR
jgi:chitin disaccharide deacetylase